jgi:hypothetical protein
LSQESGELLTAKRQEIVGMGVTRLQLLLRDKFEYRRITSLS